MLAWARDELGARFVPAQGVVHVAQPAEAIAAARKAIPHEPWRLARRRLDHALTGSALLALALARGAIDADAAWAAAHVDEDWQMSQWGRATNKRSNAAPSFHRNAGGGERARFAEIVIASRPAPPFKRPGPGADL